MTRRKVITVLAALPAATLFSQPAKFEETLHATLPTGLPLFTPNAELSGALKSAGGDTMAVLTRYWLDLFSKAHPNIKTEMEADGPATGAPALTAGAIQVAQVPRRLLVNETNAFVKKYGYEPTGFRVAAGAYRAPRMTHAIYFFVNKDNQIDRLTFAQLDAIFSKSRKRGKMDAIATWGQLGLKGEWASQQIRLWGFSQPNGVSNFVHERVLDGGEYREGIKDKVKPQGLATMDTILEGVAADRYAIGYAGIGNLTPRVKSIAVSENDGGPFLKGTFDEVAAHTYPLSRFIYAYVNWAPGKPLDPLVKEYLLTVLSKQGQQEVVREGIFLPLSAAVVSEERARLRP